MNDFEKVLLFLGGAAVGSLCTWLSVKKYYEKQAAEEREFSREYFNSKMEEKLNEKADVAMDEYSTKSDDITSSPTSIKVTNNGSMDYHKIYAADPAYEVEPVDNEQSSIDYPVVITGDEFADYTNNYEKVTLIYYQMDKTLAEEDTGEIYPGTIDDIGSNNLGRFGEFAPDTLYVRNNELKTDYEIIYDEGYFDEYGEYDDYEDD